MKKLLFADIKMLLRNRQALFWALMFPLLFTFIFGFFFGKNSVVGSAEIINHSNSPIAENLVTTLKDSGLFKITENGSIDEAKDQINRSKIAAAIIIPETFGTFAPESDNKITVIYDQGNAQSASVIVNFIDKFLTQTAFQINQSVPVFSVIQEKISEKELTYFDFVLAGILGLALMNSSIIGIAVGMAKYREDKILKRITTTPIKSFYFVLSEIISRLLLNIFQVSIILTIGVYFFDAHIYGNIFLIYLFVLIGAILFQLLGFAIASFAKTTDAAQGMATALTIPMMFLTGVFFPIDSLPKWLYSFVQYLPLAPLLRMIRNVTLEGTSPFIEPSNIIIVLSWIVVALLISTYKFKLSEE